MGGKRLKFPSRKKFVPPQDKVEQEEKKEVSSEEHEARLKMLKELGLVK
jgi:hypothetical protein